MKETVVFIQVSHQLTAPVNPMLRYYERVYAQTPGYHIAGPHFMEFPTWIAKANGMISGERYDKLVHIVTDVEETKQFLAGLPWDTILMTSVMDVNVSVLQDIMWGMEPKLKWIIGGYVDFSQYEWTYMTIILGSIYDLPHAMSGVDNLADPDYSIFGGARTIPRLSLSDGCLHNCAFCTIDREIVEYSDGAVRAQVEAFKTMRFELVYLNDKTFGQAKNWKLLRRVFDWIREFNPEFKGFIVQTTVQEALEHWFEWGTHYHIKYVEVGIEHIDSDYLKRMRKPYNLKMLKALTKDIHLYNESLGVVNPVVGFIPNLLFALPGADYKETIAWVAENVDIITFINPFILCQYGNSKGQLVESASGSNDQNENSLFKSWLSEAEIMQNKEVIDLLFCITGGGE